jgi:excinuclease ABC subunit C
LAKRLEEIFIPNKNRSLILKTNSPALYLVQSIRDEAHRFATGFYQQKHRRQMVKSALDEIVGLGPKKKKLLKKQFGSYAAMRKAKLPELSKIVGLKIAKQIKQIAIL